MRATVLPLSIRVLMSSVTEMRAVSVLWLVRNPGVDFGVFPAFGEGSRRKRRVDDGLEVRGDDVVGFVKDEVRAGVRRGAGVDRVHDGFGFFRADVGPVVEGDGRGCGFGGVRLGLVSEAVVEVADLAMEESGEGFA
ncbi:hypothetical protein NDU88_000860 [Pleurodeles waltl]|uniref:Uncharacterized protein n=1 Tax=Pleurodeles waltl TaxID=8319 RepID=A0AAV7TGN3_PLEWA|nr:hypothetical protein NDU88_000860 [Pleurodeles waltl]